MKKKTVTTTEKREVWVFRHGVSYSPEDPTTAVNDAFEIPSPDGSLEESDDRDSEEEND